jgi:hypothetical protein
VGANHGGIPGCDWRSDPNTNGNSGGNADTFSVAHAGHHSDDNSNRHPGGDAFSNAGRNSDGYRDRHSGHYANRDSDRHANCQRQLDADPHCGDADADLERDGFTGVAAA